jgi:hypothetical protein
MGYSGVWLLNKNMWDFFKVKSKDDVANAAGTGTGIDSLGE